MRFDPTQTYPNPATTAYNGEHVANIVGEWQKGNFQPIEIDATTLGINPNSLRNRLSYGLKWLCMNAETEEQRAYWVDIHDTIEIRSRTGSTCLEIYRAKAPTATIRLISDNRWLEIVTSFTRWIGTDPRIRSTWLSSLSHHTDEQLAWFRGQQAKLDADNKGYASIIRADNVKFMRILV